MKKIQSEILLVLLMYLVVCIAQNEVKMILWDACARGWYAFTVFCAGFSAILELEPHKKDEKAE